MDTEKNSSGWSDAEIQAAVDAYISMLQREQNGQQINKKYENRVLRAGVLSARTEGSVEFRMQNISTVLMEMDRPRINGYKPAKNVGANVARRIRDALNAFGTLVPEDFEPTADDAVLEERATKLEQRMFNEQPKGIAKPQLSSSSRNAFVRDPEVRAWVRQQANGICEGCNEQAPFEINGRPFLEVHHVKHLVQEGPDCPSNAVALCPNCHRRCHHSTDRLEFTASLYENVERLIRED